MHRSLSAGTASYSTVNFMLTVAVCPPPLAVTVNVVVPIGVSLLPLLPPQAVIPMPADKSSKSASHCGSRLRVMNNPAIAMSPGTVSYTHLDVYKRQAMFGDSISFGRERLRKNSLF